ncbi:hypothetical protein CHH69_13650 [Terribacillus saccharophilus]|nr:hypothetical protein CHH69_13650 [Terribacillus saccharophilus]
MKVYVRMMMLRTERYKNQTEALEYCHEAIFSLVIGILSILGVIFWDNGATLGGFGLGIAYIAHREIKKSKLKGRKFVVLGIVCSLIGIVGSFF